MNIEELFLKLNNVEFKFLTAVKLFFSEEKCCLIVLTTTALYEVHSNEINKISFSEIGWTENINANQNQILPLNEKEILIKNNLKYFVYDYDSKSVTGNKLSDFLNKKNADEVLFRLNRKFLFFDEGNFMEIGTDKEFSLVKNDGKGMNNKGWNVLVDKKGVVWIFAQLGIYTIDSKNELNKVYSLIDLPNQIQIITNVRELGKYIIICDYYGTIIFLNKQKKEITTLDLNKKFETLEVNLKINGFEVVNEQGYLSLGDSNHNIWTGVFSNPDNLQVKKQSKLNIKEDP